METATLATSLRKGATFDQSLTVTIDGTAVNFTGYTARMQVRKKPTEDGELLLDLTTSNGGIVLNATGKIRRVITATQSAALPVGNWHYDLRLTSGSGVVDYLVQGPFVVEARISL